MLMLSVSLGLVLSIAWIILLVRYIQQAHQLGIAQTQTHQLQMFQQEIVEKNQQIQQANQKVSELQWMLVQLRESASKDQQHAQEKLTLLENNKQQLKQEFENLAQHIFEAKQQQFSQQSQKNLDALLIPFKQQLDAFRLQVDHVYVSESNDRASLRAQIGELHQLNQKITEEAAQLSRALKGDKKLQGHWGEFQVQRILEQAGLKSNIDYSKELSLKTEDAQHQRPDYVIHLPEGKHIIIDSKVSLNDYVNYMNADLPEQKEKALQAHLRCLQTHVKQLSEKDYPQLIGLHSPDFVLMFVPIEAAYLVAVQSENDFFDQLFSKRIVIVTPSTLLATLTTVAHLWALEKQNQNARQLAEQAAKIHDKLCGFFERMVRLGDQIKNTQKTFDEAWSGLMEGRGNLVSQTQKLKEMGVRTKKEIPSVLLNAAEDLQ